MSAFTVFLPMLNWKKSFLLFGIKFRGHAKEEAKQQLATWIDFPTRKKNTLKIIPSHICKIATGYLAIKQSLLLMPGYKTVEYDFDCDQHRVETFGLVSGF